MRFAINIWSYPKTLSTVEAIKHAASVGYEGLEVAAGLDDWENKGKPDWQIKWERIKAEAERNKLAIPSVATGLFWRHNFITQLDEALEVVRLECEIARIVGAYLVLVVPGTGVSELNYEEHLKRAADGLKAAAEIAGEYGVKIGLENVWNRVFAGPMEVYQLLEEIGDKRIGAYFDVGNTLPHSLPEHWIRVLKERIFQVHVKDYNIAQGTFGIPLTGDVNWEAVRAALTEIGYTGYILPEVPPYPGDPVQAAEDAYRGLRKVFGK